MTRCPIAFPTCHRETERMCPTMKGPNEPTCTLGRAPVAFHLAIKDGDGKDREVGGITASQATIIREMALKFACEIQMDKSKLDMRAAHRIAGLVQMGLMTESPIIGTNRHNYRLTDAGRNIAGQLLKGSLT